LSTTFYIKDMKYFAAMNAALDSWVAEGFAPTRACIEASMAHDSLY
jgi:enamine deaminase RidA (YjgF/YER057c/UK114 family)